MCGSGGGGGGGGFVNSVVNSTAGGIPIIGDIMKGNTAQDMARQQGQMAEAQLAQQQDDRAQALKFAQPTDLQMQQLNQAVTTNTQDIARKQKLLDSADPAFIEAGRQALQMMKGGDNATTTAALQPLQKQIDQQRSQLQARMQQQLGPGWEQTTSGQQALQNFESNAQTTLNSARMSTLNQMMGYAGQSEQLGNLQPNISQSQNIVNTQGNMQARQISAIEGTPITMAGAPFVGNALSDQYAMGQMQGASNTLGNLYGSVMSQGKVNPFNGSKVPTSGGGGGDNPSTPTDGFSF